jgi:hypothetical protein
MAAFEVTTEAIAEIVLRTARPCRYPTSRIVVRKPGLAPATCCLAAKASAAEVQSSRSIVLDFASALLARVETGAGSCAASDSGSLASCWVQVLLDVDLEAQHQVRKKVRQ